MRLMRDTRVERVPSMILVARAAAGIAVLVGVIVLLSSVDALHEGVGAAAVVVGAAFAAAAEIGRAARTRHALEPIPQRPSA